jgi:4-amino-4-deoxychorismate lyase
MVREGQVFTPRMDRCGVAGVVRGALMAAATVGELPWPIMETDLTLESLVGAEEIFLTSALRGVWSVAAVDGSPVSGGKVAKACFDYWRALP